MKRRFSLRMAPDENGNALTCGFTNSLQNRPVDLILVQPTEPSAKTPEVAAIRLKNTSQVGLN
jgi:hypothetical protein